MDSKNLKKDIESEMNRLEEFRKMIKEAVEDRKNIQNLFEEEKSKYQKTILNLKNIQDNQLIRKNKLAMNLKLIENQDVDIAPWNKNEELKAELDELVKMDSESKKRVDELQSELKEIYRQIENSRVTKLMMDMGRELVKGKRESFSGNVKLVQEKSLLTAIRCKQQELNGEISRLEYETASLDSEIAKNQIYLQKLQKEEENLIKMYGELKKPSAH